MYRYLILLVLLFATPLCAHEATLTGRVTKSNAASHEGIQVTVSADPLWGFRNDAELRDVEARNGKFPEVKLSGSGETDEQGNVTIEIEFTFEGEGTPPTREIRSDNEVIETEYVYVIVTARSEGYSSATAKSFHPTRRGGGRPASHDTILVLAGGETQFQGFMLHEAVTLKGQLLMLNDRSPVAGLTVRIESITWTSGQVTPASMIGDFTTNEDGTFEFMDEELPPTNALLIPQGNELAFAQTSKGARVFSATHGVNDLGALYLVPGGGVKCRVVDDEGEVIAASCSLTLKRSGGYLTNFSRHLSLGEDGVFQAVGIPEGIYELRAAAAQHFDERFDIEVVAGELKDAGDVTVMRHLSISIIALSDGATGVENYQVLATHLSGSQPHQYRRQGENYRAQVQGNLQPERNTLNHLFAGTWRLTISAAGHASHEVDVDLPVSGPVSVTLEVGGELKVEIDPPDREKFAATHFYAVPVGHALHEELLAMTTEELKKFHPGRSSRGQPVSGLYSPSWNSRGRIKDMPAGKYFVCVHANNYGLIVEDEVEVRRGETTLLVVSPKPPRLELTLTQDGEPASGATVHLFFLEQFDWNKLKGHAEFTADANGLVTCDLEHVGYVHVLGTREGEFALAGADETTRALRVRAHTNLRLSIHWGETMAQAIELNQPGRVWLTLKLNVQEDALAGAPRLSGSGGRARNVTHGEAAGTGVWLFPAVPVGDYRLEIPVSDQGDYVVRDVAVDTPPEQVIEVTLDITVVRLKLAYPEGMNRQFARVLLIPEDKVGDPFALASVPTKVLQDSDAVAFGGVEGGRHLAVAVAFDQPGRHPNASRAFATSWVDASTEGEQTLHLNSGAGTLELNVVANPAVGNADLPKAGYRVRFFDQMLEEVFPADYLGSFGSYNTPAQVRGIPVGTYTIRVSGHGIQPIEQHDVRIGESETVSLTMTPSAAGLLRLTIEEMTTFRLAAAKARSVYLDADGQEVDPEAPGGRTFTPKAQPAQRFPGRPFPEPSPEPSEEEKDFEGYLLNLSPRVRSVVIRLDGYEDIVIPVDVEPGKTIVHTAKVEPKAD